MPNKKTQSKTGRPSGDEQLVAYVKQHGLADYLDDFIDESVRNPQNARDFAFREKLALAHAKITNFSMDEEDLASMSTDDIAKAIGLEAHFYHQSFNYLRDVLMHITRQGLCLLRKAGIMLDRKKKERELDQVQLSREQLILLYRHIKACPTAYFKPTGEWMTLMNDMNRMEGGLLRVILALGGNMGGKTVWMINALVLPFCLPNGDKLNPYIANWDMMQNRREFMRFSGTEVKGTHRLGLIVPPKVLHQAFLPKLKEWAPVDSWHTTNDGGSDVSRIIFHDGGEIVVYSPYQQLPQQAGGELDFILATEPFPIRMVGEMQGRIRTWGGMFFENCPDYNKDAADLVRLIETMIKEDSYSALIHSFHLASTCSSCEVNGFVPHGKIEQKIKEVNALNPHSVPARIAGLPMYYSNRLFPQFDPNKHVWPEQDIIEELRSVGASFYEGIDSHDQFAYATLICAVDPKKRLFVIEEWPRYEPSCDFLPEVGDDAWLKNAIAPKPQPLHLQQIDWAADFKKMIKVLHYIETEIIKTMAGGFKSDGTAVFERVNAHIQARYMDPRDAGKGKKTATGKTNVLAEMRKVGKRYGMYFFKSPQQGKLEWRHRVIRGKLSGINPYSDEEIKEGRLIDIEEIIVSERCQNFIYVMENITYIKETKFGARDDTFHSEPKIDEELKHLLDAFAYIIQRNPTYHGPIAEQEKSDQGIVDIMIGDLDGLIQRPNTIQNHGAKIVCN